MRRDAMSILQLHPAAILLPGFDAGGDKSDAFDTVIDGRIGDRLV